MKAHPKARFALHAIDFYRDLVGDQDEFYPTVIADFLADLMHLCRAIELSLTQPSSALDSTSIMRSRTASTGYATSVREDSAARLTAA